MILTLIIQLVDCELLILSCAKTVKTVLAVKTLLAQDKYDILKGMAFSPVLL